MNYRLLTLSKLTPLEPAGPLPAWLVAANPSEDQITDLGWSGRTGQSYFRIAIADDPPFDPDTHRLSDPVEGKPDPDTKTIPAVREVVALTADEIAARNPIPDNPTLGDWRVALVLWGRLADVLGRIKTLVDAGNPLGVVAQERVEYSNNVLLAQLLQLKDVFGFTEADVIESLWRADRVSKGDLSGVWPLPEAA